ncbi:PREDICTED: bone morphogenetic protein 4-like, partial [Ceratosolen solmsi marchali]|uniref:Bone morphogenetic protein 4-like n=1 Tax=Ceratosolen solmsi marchali TaxID=326594 RepID=A0AAJ6YN95_9HYME
MVRMLLITTMMLIFELRIVKLSAMELLFEGDSNLQPIWDSDGVGISELQGEPVNLQKDEALEEFKETLGIRGNFKKDSYKGTPPQFMTELYNTITDSAGQTHSSSVGYFIFNVSGLDQNEFVLEAELHLYRQRSSPKSMPLSIKVYQVLQDKSLGVPDLHRLLNVHYVGAYASGWQVFNVKQAVLSWLSGIPNLGLLVSATTIFGDRVSINFSSRHDLPHEKQPILVLFNDDSVQVYPKQIVNHEKEDKVDNKQRAITDLEDV